MAILGAVIPSHKAPPTPVGDGSSATWAIWNGALKAYKLDDNGDIPLAPPLTPTPDLTETATPTPVPSSTVTPLPVGYPDERSFKDADPKTRRPVWNAARVLGYTDPVANLAGGAAPTPAVPVANASPISVWPGRRMVWGWGTGPTVPLGRRDFMPNTDSCVGTTTAGQCFYDLMVAMNLTPGVTTDVTRATRTVQFLRGGKTAGGSRDEILNDLGTYGTVIPNTIYSYRYQDDIPVGNPPSAQTDGDVDPKYYSHKLGDIFHSEAALLLPPRYFQYLSGNINPRKTDAGVCGGSTSPAGPIGCSYGAFASFHAKRRKVVFVGANDGFLHAFDAGVFDRDDANFNDTFDLGTGREIFAYAPKSIMKAEREPDPRIPESPELSPEGAVLRGRLARGRGRVHRHRPLRHARFEEPDLEVGPGERAAPGRPQLLRAGRHAAGQRRCRRRQGDRQGQLARLHGPRRRSSAARGSCRLSGDLSLGPLGADRHQRPRDGRDLVSSRRRPHAHRQRRRLRRPLRGHLRRRLRPDLCHRRDGRPGGDTHQGRAIYIVNVETGNVLYKETQGKASSGGIKRFAPMPAPPAVVDVDDDGYLDVAYIGDLNGRMWRLNLRTAACSSCGNSNESLTGLEPFLLYDAMTGDEKIQPIFLDAGIIYISGGATPVLGVGFGTGYRAELLRSNPNLNRFHFVLDPGTEGRTFFEEDLVNITPNCPLIATVPPCVSSPGGPPRSTRACNDSLDTQDCGYFLDFATADEKAVSTVFSTLGNLSVVTFHPTDTNVKCGSGTSYRYSFVYSSGVGAYGVNQSTTAAGEMTDYRQELGSGLAGMSQSQSPTGDMIDTVIFSGGGIYQKNTPATLKSLNQNWKEQ